MSEYKEAFVAFDVAKVKNAVALAEGDRNGEVRYLGEIANTPEATLKLVKKLEGNTISCTSAMRLDRLGTACIGR